MNSINSFLELEEKYGDDFNWMSISSDLFVKELRLELGDECQQYPIDAIAKCCSNDDVLFKIDGNYIIYHLTYSGKKESDMSCLRFGTLTEAIKYIENDFTENYM